jgi:hypothetical protein
VEEHNFAFSALILLYESIEGEYPNIDMEAPVTILGDGDAQQMAAVETESPDTQYRLYIWNVNRNIQTKLLPRIEAEFDSRSNNGSSDEERKKHIDETWKIFEKDWMGALQVNLPEFWISNWKRFRDDYENRFPSVMRPLSKALYVKFINGSTNDAKNSPERYMEVSAKIREIIRSDLPKKKVTRGAAFRVYSDEHYG